MYLISQLAILCKTNIQTIREYEKYGLIKHIASNKNTRIRQYDEQTLEKLLLIEESRALGLGLPEIKNLLRAWFNNRVSNQKRTEILGEFLELLAQKEAQLKDVRSRLELLIAEMKKFV